MGRWTTGTRRNNDADSYGVARRYDQTGKTDIGDEKTAAAENIYGIASAFVEK
jgi:hypothetical protein